VFLPTLFDAQTDVFGKIEDPIPSPRCHLNCLRITPRERAGDGSTPLAELRTSGENLLRVAQVVPPQDHTAPAVAYRADFLLWKHGRQPEGADYALPSLGSLREIEATALPVRNSGGVARASARQCGPGEPGRRSASSRDLRDSRPGASARIRVRHALLLAFGEVARVGALGNVGPGKLDIRLPGRWSLGRPPPRRTRQWPRRRLRSGLHQWRR